MTASATPGVATYADCEQIAAEIAQAAARRIREKQGTTGAVATKTSATDVVTETDVEIEDFITAELLRFTPTATILGEERSQRDGTSSIAWIIDPIDGTVNYLYDLPIVSVSIAAAIEGEVIAGAIADVHRREVFTARKGGGATRDGEPIKAESSGDLSCSLIGTGFSYSANQRAREATVVARILPRVRDIRCMGSAALNLAWVACGRLDGYFEGDVSLWDVAAGALIVEEALGSVRFEPETDPMTVIAASTALYEELEASVNA